MSDEAITLINKPLPDLPATLKNVFATKKSVKSYEYYRAKSTGIIPSCVFSLFKYDYSGELRITHNGVLYNIERSYVVGDFTELTCVEIKINYNAKISIRRIINTKNPYGFVSKNVEQTISVYAYVEEKPQTETDTSAVVAPKKIIARFEYGQYDVDNYYELIYNNYIFNIKSCIKILGREEFVEVEAEEVV